MCFNCFHLLKELRLKISSTPTLQHLGLSHSSTQELRGPLAENALLPLPSSSKALKGRSHGHMGFSGKSRRSRCPGKKPNSTLEKPRSDWCSFQTQRLRQPMVAEGNGKKNFPTEEIFSLLSLFTFISPTWPTKSTFTAIVDACH